ncbi:MAG: MDR family MFS transporter [Pseudomonadales bacterium]
MTQHRSNHHALMMASIMVATVMYTLDSTIAAVALPHMQGTFSAAQDQIAWVLTSYIVASAIMTPMAGYLSDRIGRRRLFMFTVIGFIVTSMACGLAMNLEEMVIFRILQGMFGAPLIPLAQAAILDAYTPATYGRGMALFGVGVMLGPIVGPTLGGWLTEYLNWRWVFFINLPVGILALAGIMASIEDHPEEDRERPFDLAGFAYLAIGIGALQLMLDRGNTLSWFESVEIQVEALVAVLCLYLFVVQILTRNRPFIDPQIFRDRNFSFSLLVSFVVGFNLLATMAILPPLMQNLLGYPVLTTGWILAPRGVGTMISMSLVGRLVEKFDPRHLIIFGLACMALSLWQMAQFDRNVTTELLIGTGLLQGFGMGFTFVPMSTMAFSTLPPRYRPDASGFYSLSRNIGSSVGISVLMGALAVYYRQNREALVPHVTPFTLRFGDTAGVPFLDPDSPEGLSMLDGIVQQEALMLGYLDDFRLMMVITVLAIPLVFLLRPVPRAAA